MKLPFSKKPAPPEIREEDANVVGALVDAMREGKFGAVWGSRIKEFRESHPELVGRVMDVKGEARGYMAVALLRKARSISRGHGLNNDFWVREDLVQCAGRLVAVKDALSLELFPRFVEAWHGASQCGVSYTRIIGVAENLVAQHGLTEEMATTLRPILEKLEREREYPRTADERKQAIRLRQLLFPESRSALHLPEPWQTPFKDPSWVPLLVHAATAKTNVMSDRWAKAARPLLEASGTDRFLEAFAEAVDAVGRMTDPVDTLHSDMLRGLAWIAGLTGTPRAAALLGRLTLVSAHKLSGIGPRSQKGFSGAVGALEKMGTFASLAELSNARNRIKAATLSAAIVAALSRAAERQVLPMEELEELVVPTYGLEMPGIRREADGAVAAELEIVGSVDVVLRWFREGKELKSPPTDAKELAKELKAAKKEVEAALTAQRARIEGMMLTGRTLPYPQWRERYLEHPLLANMVRRLVWRFADADGERLGIALEGEPLDIEGNLIQGLGESTTVRLWHPIQAGLSAIEAWRDFLISREVRQPFKQAYREIYILTAAEERTRTYSNRFAAHVLKQHQMNALARARGWRYALQGYFDSYNNPTLDLPAWGLRAEYFVQVPDMGTLPESQTMTEMGIAFYVVTDQVRFVDRASDEPVHLETVPPVVLSEVMRDVDLFVGVASVGNDPSWEDQGEQTGFGAYWRQSAFGDLSATAETRKAVLERLLPRLAIGKVSRIEGKFLVVKGKRRTYKIHLGSGNILMEPNDQYLCIVPGTGAKAADRVYLPFEGDGILAIILSKAMLLANDDKITDPTITGQL